MAFRTVTELPDSMADDDAVEAALVEDLKTQHGLIEIGSISGETRSHVFRSTGANTTSEGYAAGKEVIFFEIHHISGDEWALSSGIGDNLPTSLIGRTALKSFYPRKNSTTERSIVASNGVVTGIVDRADLDHEWLFEGTGIATVGTVDLDEGPSAPTYLTGITGQGFDLSTAGTNTALRTPTSITTLSTADWTVCFWLNLTATTDGIIISPQIPLDGPIIDIFSGDMRLGGGGLSSNSVGTPSTSVWEHWGFSHTGGTVSVYKNGSSVGTGTGSYTDTEISGFYVGRNSGAGTGADGVIDGLQFWSKALNGTELTDIYNSGNDRGADIEEPTVLEVVTHNTSVNTGTGVFNPAITGRLTDGQEPFITTLSVAATASDTDIQLTDAIFDDMDPNLNNAQASKVWITDLTNATQEEVTVTSTTAFGQSRPTTDPLSNSFPLGSLVSDFPYKLVASDLTDDGTIEHWSESDQANLVQSFNDNYEGTIVNAVDSAGDNLGFIPFIRCQGQDPALVQGEVIHKERQDLGGSFENRRMFNKASILETTDGSGNNTTTVLQVAGASFPDLTGQLLEVTSGAQIGATGTVLSNTATAITLTSALPGIDADYDSVTIDVVDENIYSIPRGV